MRDNAGRSEASMREQHHLKSEALPYVGRCLEARTLKRLLSMPRLAIFDSRVCGGTPSFAAAPSSPETRPRQATMPLRSPSFGDGQIPFQPPRDYQEGHERVPTLRSVFPVTTSLRLRMFLRRSR